MIEINISRGTAAAFLSNPVVPNNTGVNIIITVEIKSKGKKLCRTHNNQPVCYKNIHLINH